MTPQDAAKFSTMFNAIVDNISRAVLGKKRVIRLVLTTLIAEGHILLEDAPGTGKTVLAKSLAASIEGSHSRIQFTPDLLPSDVTGVNIYDQHSGTFEFHKGPVFASIVLADEINRASPKTQSALLEVMEESKVTVDGVTYGAGRPFMVIATQNPIEQTGTYKLPEAQLDRFLMKTALGYPDHDSVITILTGSAQRDRTASLRPVISGEDITVLSDIAGHVYLNPAIADYVARLGAATRNDAETRIGVSVRGCIALVRASKVWAAAQGRNFVIPDDIKELASEVFTHRIILDPESEFNGVTPADVMTRILASVAPPTEQM